jgi:hypothetical protein
LDAKTTPQGVIIGCDFTIRAQDRQVKAWWFAQGAGAGAAVFVQAKYGTKVIALSGAGNSVQVATVGDVAAVLAAIKDAVVGGELDNAISAVISARKVTKTRSVK